MSFLGHESVSSAPKRTCPDRFGGLLAVYPPGVLRDHERAGYTYRPNMCTEAVAYDPDYCVAPGDLKKDPDNFGPAKDAILGMLQTAVNCTVGASMDELREAAQDGLDANIERAIETDLVNFLATVAVASGSGSGVCALGAAAQFLATDSYCGRGVILGPVGWFVTLESALIWNQAKGYHHDFVGNIVIPHSVDNDTVYALDNAIEIKVSEVMLLDEVAPGIRLVNDRVIRAEQLYTIAVDSCVVGSITVEPCVP